jgi:hypothetical protein
MNRFIDLQESLYPVKKKKLRPENKKPAVTAKSLSAVYDNVFGRPAFNFSEARSYYGTSLSKGYYDWPDKFGTGVAGYDDAAAAWIASCRSAVTDFAGLTKTTSYLGGWSYNGVPSKDPAPDWKVTDPAKLKVYDAVRKELFTEGGANSVNTYDNQVVTLGWGHSMLWDDGKKVIRYNMDSSPDFRNAMLEVGITVKNNEVLYVDTTAKKIVKGTDALQKIRWDVKVLSRIITAMDAIAQINVDNQARIMKEGRLAAMPAEAYKWPLDSMRLALHLYHWQPSVFSWKAVKSSGGDVAAIVKSFCKSLRAFKATGYKKDFELSDLANGALYVKDYPPRLDMGNKVFIKAGDSGTIKRIEKSEFKEDYKTNAAYKDYVFVELGGKVYLLP